jgi:O-antigen ligase
MKPITSLLSASGLLGQSYRLYGLIFLFAFFLVPVSLSVRGDNVSSNYNFILLPLIVLLFGQKLQLPSKTILALVSIYIAIFIICFAYQDEYLKFSDRRLISFVLFMSWFSLCFVKIDEEMYKAFKYAIILVSFVYSMNSIYLYFAHGGSANVYSTIHPIVQSQRYGFILLFGFWLIIFEKTKTLSGLVIKLLIIFTIFNGLGFTFSRSSVAALLVSTSLLLLLLLLKIWKHPLKQIPQKNIAWVLISIAIGALFITLSYQFMPAYFQFFSERIFKVHITPIRAIDFFPYTVFLPYDTTFYLPRDTSEGYRLYLIAEASRFLSHHPLFGSGYLGVWIMFSDLAGSAHNQLLDVLFRTGLVGFACFLYVVYRIIKFNLYHRHWAVLLSLAGIFTIGMFHETFKLSHGAFVFAFLIAQAFNDVGDIVQPDSSVKGA